MIPPNEVCFLRLGDALHLGVARVMVVEVSRHWQIDPWYWVEILDVIVPSSSDPARVGTEREAPESRLERKGTR